MTLPLFAASEDPGYSFVNLLRQVGMPHQFEGLSNVTPAGMSPYTGTRVSDDAFHGTTCVAICYPGGVILAGDRRASSNYYISHHRINKVFSADSHSGVAIAGTLGVAVELVRLFQCQLAHYEKVEGAQISLEGKANQLGQMVKANVSDAMRGLGMVVPIFAGFDFATSAGRIFEYDITGGYCEGNEYASVGSGGIHADPVMKLGHCDVEKEQDAVELALRALLIASDSDPATAGPDTIRKIFPTVSIIDVQGYREVAENEIKDISTRLIQRFGKFELS